MHKSGHEMQMIKKQALFANLSMVVSQKPLKQLHRLRSNHCFINLSLESDSFLNCLECSAIDAAAPCDTQSAIQ